MPVKLFRETGRADLLDAKEARLATRRAINPLWLALALALWLASVGNLALWRALSANNPMDASARLSGFETLGLAGMLFFGTFALLAPLAWRYLIKWVALALLIATALGLHMLLFVTDAQAPLLLNFFKSSMREPRAWFNVQLWLSVLLLGVLPAALMWKLRLRRGHVVTQVLRIAVVLVLAAGGYLTCQALWGESLRAKLAKQPEAARLIMPLNWRSGWPGAWASGSPQPATPTQ